MGAGALFSQLINLAVLAELTLREVADCLLDPEFLVPLAGCVLMMLAAALAIDLALDARCYPRLDKMLGLVIRTTSIRVLLYARVLKTSHTLTPCFDSLLVLAVIFFTCNHFFRRTTWDSWSDGTTPVPLLGMARGLIWCCALEHAILWAYGLQPLKGEAEAEAEGKKGEDLTILVAILLVRLLWGALSHWREDWPVPAENDSEYKAVIQAVHQLNDKCSKRRTTMMMMHEMDGGVYDVRMLPPLRKRAGPLLPLA